MAIGVEAVLASVGERRRATALPLLVFAAGVGSMSTEIAASRLLAPYYGASTVVWANVIGLVLASLSLGYWLGGRLADRYPSSALLGWIVLAAAVEVALIPLVARPFLDWAVSRIDQASAGVVVGSFFGSLVLFAPAVTVLGMVTPFAIRIGIDDVRSAGKTAGRTFALSTGGSLLGTFLPALVTIPLIGTQRTLLASAVLIALGACVLLGPAFLVAPAAVAALLAVPPGAVKATPGLLYERESPYQYVQVVQRGQWRYLYLNEGVAIHSLWNAKTVLTGGEWDMFLTMPPLVHRPAGRVLILGNAGGTIARALGVFFPRARVDGVELDPVVTEVGRRFFGLGDNPRLRVFTADARPFLRSTRRRYDLIFVDAYRQPYVPFYLATEQFFELARSHLRAGGAIALNVATVPGDHGLAEGVAGTLATVFPEVLTWQALRLNQLVIGLMRPAPRIALRRRLDRAPRRLRVLGRLLTAHMRQATAAADPWTDDRAPVEWITDRMIAEYAAHGGRGDERLLPTAP